MVYLMRAFVNVFVLRQFGPWRVPPRGPRDNDTPRRDRWRALNDRDNGQWNRSSRKSLICNGT
jgi:hypothetical protein